MISFNDCIRTGRITKKWGFNNEVLILFDGKVNVKSLITEPVFLETEGKLVPFFLSTARKHGKNGIIAGLLDATESLLDRITGCDVWVRYSKGESEETGIPSEGRLSGYMVTDIRLGEIGRALKLIEREMQPLLLVEHNDKEILIPFIPQIIIKTDHKNRRILVETPEGLTDL